MSTTYDAVTGDTFESIARKKYGSEFEADRIRRANPGVVEPLTAGETLVIPDNPQAPRDRLFGAPSDNVDEVALTVDGRRFRYWSNIKITRSIDAMDRVQFNAPFEPDSADFRETFQPFTYKPLTVTLGGDPLFTGTMVAVDPSLEEDNIQLSVSGYSTPGVLNDCTPPVSDYPLEYNNLNLYQISQAIAAPFGLGVVFTSLPGARFERAACDPGKSVLEFLIDLASQRGLVVASTETGFLLFQESVDFGVPVATLRQGEAPVLSVTPRFQPQSYYSSVTALSPVNVGQSGAKYTVRNPHLSGALRPYTFTPKDAEDPDVKGAADAKIGRMFANMASYTVRVPTWRDPKGDAWRPNTVISLEAPGAMIYRPYLFTIRSVELEASRDVRTATLELMLPGAFRGEIPESLPWAV